MPTRAYAMENIPMTRTLVTDAITVRIIGSHLTSTLVQAVLYPDIEKKLWSFHPKSGFLFVLTRLAVKEGADYLYSLFFICTHNSFLLIIFHCTHRLYSRGWQ